MTLHLYGVHVVARVRLSLLGIELRQRKERI